MLFNFGFLVAWGRRFACRTQPAEQLFPVVVLLLLLLLLRLLLTGRYDRTFRQLPVD